MERWFIIRLLFDWTETRVKSRDFSLWIKCNLWTKKAQTQDWRWKNIETINIQFEKFVPYFWFEGIRWTTIYALMTHSCKFERQSPYHTIPHSEDWHDLYSYIYTMKCYVLCIHTGCVAHIIEPTDKNNIKYDPRLDSLRFHFFFGFVLSGFLSMLLLLLLLSVTQPIHSCQTITE